MNREQSNKRNMYGKVSIFFANNAAIWAAFARLVTEITIFLGLVQQIDDEAQKQAVDNTGVTLDKDQLRLKMAEILVKPARKTLIFAIDTNNNTLAVRMNVQKDDFLKGKESEALTLAKDVLADINANIGSLAPYKVLPADVTACTNAIAAFQGSTGTPGAAEGITESGTEALPLLYQKADKSLDIIYDLFVSEYSDSHPDEVNEFKNDHQIDNIGIHHTGLRIHFTDAATGQNLEGAKLEIQGVGKNSKTHKTTTANIHGIAEIIKTNSGDYHATFSLQGYKTEYPVISLKRGKILNLDIQLEPGTTTTGTVIGSVMVGGAHPASLINVEGTGISTTTDPMGNYVLNNVPSGNQQLRAAPIANPANFQLQATNIPAGGTATVNFVIP